MNSCDIVELPSTGVCPECHVDWSSHLMVCGMTDCQVTGLHCHRYAVIDEWGFSHFISGILPKRIVTK